MSRRALLILVLLASCGAEEFGLRPPSFEPERQTAIVAFFENPDATEPEQILAFDLRLGPVRFGFRSEAINPRGEVIALGYNETIEEMELIAGAVTRPTEPVQCMLTSPEETQRAVLADSLWSNIDEAPRVVQFITGNMDCGDAADCIDLTFTRSSPVDRDLDIQLSHVIEPDTALILGGHGVLLASPETTTSTGFPDFYNELPSQGSSRTQTGESYFFGGTEVVRVNSTFTEIEYRESFSEYRIFGATPSPDGQRILALTSTHKDSGPPPYSVRIWLRENGVWSILTENNFVPPLVPTTSPIAWRNNNEAYIAFRGAEGTQGIFYRFRDNQVIALNSVPGPAGVVTDSEDRVFVGSSLGHVYYLNDNDVFENIGGKLDATFHGIEPIQDGVFVGGAGGRFQEVYIDGRECPVKNIASGIVSRIRKNGDGYLATGVLTSFVIWTD